MKSLNHAFAALAFSLVLGVPALAGIMDTPAPPPPPPCSASLVVPQEETATPGDNHIVGDSSGLVTDIALNLLQTLLTVF